MAEAKVKTSRKKTKKVPEVEESIVLTGVTQFGPYTYLEGSAGSMTLNRISKDLLSRGCPVVMDLETTGKDPLIDKVLLVGFTYDGVNAYVFNPESVDMTPFLEVLRRNPIRNHFIKFDYKFIKAHYGVEMNIDWDTQVTHAISTAGIAMFIGGNGLGNLSNRYLGVKLNKDERKQFITGKWRSNNAISYCAEDCQATWKLYPVTKEMLTKSGMVHIWEEIERPLISVIADIELNGINLDLRSALDLRDKYQEKLEKVLQDLEQQAPGINFGSPKQLIEFFTSAGVTIPMKDRKNGKKTPSVDEASLKKISHPLARSLEQYREYSKALSAFLIPWTTSKDEDPDGKYNPKTGCIHAEMTQVDTDTGRSSMRDPNLQQVPSDSAFRHVFVAPKGQVMVNCDYSQYELRVLAELSQDPTMKELFSRREAMVSEFEKAVNSKGLVHYTPELGKKYPEIQKMHDDLGSVDYHSQTAIAIFKLDPKKIDFDGEEWKKYRKAAKEISFGIPYGSGSATIAERAKLKKEEAEEKLKDYFTTFKMVKKYIDETKASVSIPCGSELPTSLGLTNMDLVWSESIGGRKRFYIYPPMTLSVSDRRQQKARIQRQAVNHRIQATNADVTKLAMILLHNEFKKPEFEGAYMRLMVHDEIVVSCPKAIADKVAIVQINAMKEASKRYVKTIPVEVSCSINTKWDH